MQGKGFNVDLQDDSNVATSYPLLTSMPFAYLIDKVVVG